MMTIQCPSCSKTYNIPETMAGKQVRCKQCSMVFAIAPLAEAPQVAPQAEAPAAGQSQSSRTRTARAGAMTAGKKPLMLIGGAVIGVVALAALAIFVVIPMIAGGQPGWTKALMPEGTKMVAYIDFEEFRESDLFAKIEEMAKKQTGGQVGDADKAVSFLASMFGLTSKMKVDDINSLFVAAADMDATPPKLIVGIRLNRGMPLKDVISGENVVKSKHKDMEYVTIRLGGQGMAICLGQIDDETFCLALSEGELKKALDRVESGETVELSDELASILDEVSGSDFYIAVDIAAISKGKDKDAPKRFGAGLDINGSIDLLVTAVFEDSKTAEEQANMVEKQLDVSKKEMAAGIAKAELNLDKASGEAKEAMEKQVKVMKMVAKWAEDVDIDHSGETVKGSVSVDTDDVLEIFDDAMKMVPGMPFGSSPRAMPPRRPRLTPRQPSRPMR